MICPYCRSDLGEDRRTRGCTRCHTRVHRDCAVLHDGRCVVFGCEGRVLVPRSASRRAARRTARHEPGPASRALRAAVQPIDDPVILFAALGGLVGLLLAI